MSDRLLFYHRHALPARSELRDCPAVDRHPTTTIDEHLGVWFHAFGSPLLRSRFVFTALFLCCLGAPPSLRDTLENQAFQAALTSIKRTNLGHHVDVLADDSFEGRQAGSRGGRAAGGYLVDAMKNMALQPAGVDGGYFQGFGNGYRNVLGMIEGSDPKLKHEFILIGAHYDHVGYGSRHEQFRPDRLHP